MLVRVLAICNRTHEHFSNVAVQLVEDAIVAYPEAKRRLAPLKFSHGEARVERIVAEVLQSHANSASYAILQLLEVPLSARG